MVKNVHLSESEAIGARNDHLYTYPTNYDRCRRRAYGSFGSRQPITKSNSFNCLDFAHEQGQISFTVARLIYSISIPNNLSHLHRTYHSIYPSIWTGEFTYKCIGGRNLTIACGETKHREDGQLKDILRPKNR